MSTQQAAWNDLPLGVQQCILVLTGGPWVRRVSKAWRDGFDAANDTLCFRLFVCKSLKVAATAAAMRVVKNSASLTAVNFVEQQYGTTPPPLMLSDLLAAGAASGLATRLRKLTGMKVTAPWAVQQLQALRQCTGLTHLDINGSDLRDCLAEDLTAALQAMPRLTCLHVWDSFFQSQTVVAALASALQLLTQLQHLHLASCRPREAWLAALAPALSAMPGLQMLDIGNNLVTWSSGAKALCTLLCAVPGLTHLDVSFSRLQDEGTALLAPVLRGMTRLQTLNMCGALMSDNGMALLAPALAALPHLCMLDLSRNQLGTGAASALQHVLAREGSPLRNLKLSSNVFLREGAHFLASGLSTATRLQGLDLRYTRLADEGWVALAPALRRLAASLQSLQLGPESLDAAGSAALASSLKTLSGLTRLKARHCFTPAALVTISPALVGMRRLQVLDLSGSVMSGKGIAAFAAVLPSLAGSLEQLTLEDCIFGVEAAANVLAPALAQATCLVALRLSDNDLGPQGAQWLVPVLSALPCLRRADLHSCRLGVPGCMAVARALKGRDGAVVGLRGSGVTKNHVESVELCEMPGINVCV